jgi:Ca2+/Na+ antiporter
MRFLNRFKILAYLVILLSLVAFNYAATDYGMLALSLLVWGMSWWLVESTDATPFPRWMINVGVLLVALYLFWELVIERQPNLLLGLGHFMTGLILCKLLEKKTNRDYAQLLILSLLLILSGAILTTSPIFAVFLLLYLGLGLYLSLIFHLQAETQSAVKRNASPDNMMLNPAHEKVIARDMRRITWSAAVFLFVFASVVFVLFPRTGVPGILAKWQIGGSRVQTGFTNRVTLGQLGHLHQSNAIIAEIRITRNGKNIGSEGYQPYFMGSTLEVYLAKQHQWVRASSPAKNYLSLHVSPGHWTKLVNPNDYERHDMITDHVMLRYVPDDTLFSQLPAVEFKLDRRAEVTRLNDGTLIFTGSAHSSVNYSVRVPRHFNSAIVGPQHPALFPSVIEYSMFPSLTGYRSIQSAPIAKPIAAMARRIAGPLLKKHITRKNIAQIYTLLADRFCNYLRTHYPYSFDMTPVNPHIDPTEDFLLNKKKIGGYCEYFASAMVMFCRSVGIPSRIVTGYHGGDYNPIAGYYIVRQKFAHAWVQVWIPGRGWVSYDPSPASSLTSVQQPVRWYSQILDFVQWIRLQWLQTIIAFNNSMRLSIIRRVFMFFKACFLTTVNFGHMIIREIRLMGQAVRTSWTGRIVAGVIFLGILAMGIFFARRVRRQRGVVAEMVRHLDPRIARQMARDLAFVDHLMDSLRRLGSERNAEQTPLEYVRELTLVSGVDLPEAHWLVEMFYGLRYGDMKMNAAISEKIRESLAALDQRLRSINTPGKTAST